MTRPTRRGTEPSPALSGDWRRRFETLFCAPPARSGRVGALIRWGGMKKLLLNIALAIEASTLHAAAPSAQPSLVIKGRQRVPPMSRARESILCWCALFAVVMVSSCTTPRRATPLQAWEGLAIAVKAFCTQQHPVVLSNYEITMSDDIGDQWNFWFTGRGEFADPGGYTLIRVNKHSAEVTIEPSF